MHQNGATLHMGGATKTRINPDVQTRDAPSLLSCLSISPVVAIKAANIFDRNIDV